MCRYYPLFFAILSAVLTSCSHSYFTHDRTNPNYYSGGTRFYPINFWKITQKQEEAPEGQTNKPVPEQPKSVSETEAAVGVLASGISLLIYRDYYQSPHISGTCVCAGVKDSVIEIPCPELAVKLLDASGKEVQRSHTVGGEFFFSVPPDKEFSVEVDSSDYQILGEPKRALYLGDQVILHLIRTKSDSLFSNQ